MFHIKKIETGSCSQIFHTFTNGRVLLQDKGYSSRKNSLIQSGPDKRKVVSK